MTPLETVVLASYFFILIVLAGYGWHRYYLVYAYMKHKDQVPVPAGTFEQLPRVTVQLPIYNEMYVVERLIDSVAQMDYPRDRFEVQVLDDSTDETRSIAELAVRRAAAQGLDIMYLHRTDRTGFKAGALEAGMQRGQRRVHRDLRRRLPAVARFPAADGSLLRRTEGRHGPGAVGPHQRGLLAAHPDSGDFARRTLRPRAGGRNRAGHFFNFNGTAGIWRREAIIDAGGWQHDTLTEDLDLSYRAQFWAGIRLPA